MERVANRELGGGVDSPISHPQHRPAPEDGVRPLYMAAHNDHPRVVSALLRKGADPQKSTAVVLAAFLSPECFWVLHRSPAVCCI